MNLKWLKTSNHWGPFSVLSDKVLYSFTFSSSWTQLFILLPVIPVSGHWGFILCKTDKTMAIVGYQIGTYINTNYFESLRCWNSFQCNVLKAFCQIFFFSPLHIQSLTAVGWMGNTKILGINTTTIKNSSLFRWCAVVLHNWNNQCGLKKTMKHFSYQKRDLRLTNHCTSHMKHFYSLWTSIIL